RPRGPRQTRPPRRPRHHLRQRALRPRPQPHGARRPRHQALRRLHGLRPARHPHPAPRRLPGARRRRRRRTLRSPLPRPLHPTPRRPGLRAARTTRRLRQLLAQWGGVSRAKTCEKGALPESIQPPPDRGSHSDPLALHWRPTMRSRILALCTLTLLCVRAHADSAPIWLQVTTPHFTVLTDASAKQARHIAGQFERMQAVFQKLLPASLPDPGSPIIVLAVKNSREFAALQPAAYQQKGSLKLAGLFVQNTDRNYILVRLDTEGPHP